MGEGSVITEEMRWMVGVETSPYTIKIKEGDLQRFVEAIGETKMLFTPNRWAKTSKYGGVMCPPTFFCPDPIIAGDLTGLKRPWPFPYSLDGGTEWEFHQPVRVGDTLRITTKIAGLYEKQGSGKTGRMMITIIEARCINQRKELVGVARGNAIVYEGSFRQGEQLCFEDVEVGMHLPPLTKGPLTIKDLTNFSAATNDHSKIHYDESVARDRGLSAPLVHGPLKSAFLAQMLTNWIGSEGKLKKLNCQYRRMDVAGETLICHGKVAGKSTREVESRVECDVWVENTKGEVTTRGTAVFTLPTREARALKQPDKESLSSRNFNEIALINDKMRKDLKLGEVSGVFTYDVDRNWISQFATAFDDPNPLWHDEDYSNRAGLFGGIIAPPTFFAALDPVETKELILDEWVETIPYKDTGGGNAFNEVEYFLPIRPGDTITAAVTYTRIYERDGRSGRLLFRIRENELRNQHGELVALARCGHVRSYDLHKKRDA